MPDGRPSADARSRNVDLATGNVEVLPAARSVTGSRREPRRQPDVVGAAAPSSSRWVIHDGHGTALEPASSSRSEALWRMGVLAFRGAELPLTLFGPDGRPTGDRLA